MASVEAMPHHTKSECPTASAAVRHNQRQRSAGSCVLCSLDEPLFQQLDRKEDASLKFDVRQRVRLVLTKTIQGPHADANSPGG
jgi:hypothetical protein